MTLRDYYELADPLVLPIRQKDYEIPPATASDVIRYRIYMAKLEAGTLTAEDRIDDEDYLVTFLGTALLDMRADGVHPGVIQHAAQTALAEALAGREIAETVWNAADPKAQSALLSAGLRDGLDAIDEYGRGDYDELTGTYEWYEVPAEVTASRASVDWGLILGRLDLLAFDMQRHLGLRLTTVVNTYTWREFAHLVSGLLGLEEHLVTPRGVTSIPATLLGSHFHTPENEEPDDE